MNPADHSLIRPTAPFGERYLLSAPPVTVSGETEAAFRTPARFRLSNLLVAPAADVRGGSRAERFLLKRLLWVKMPWPGRDPYDRGRIYVEMRRPAADRLERLRQIAEARAIRGVIVTDVVANGESLFAYAPEQEERGVSAALFSAAAMGAGIQGPFMVEPGVIAVKLRGEGRIVLSILGVKYPKRESEAGK